MNIFSTNNENLNKDEISRYARHISLKEIGVKGQKKLKASSVICIGTGGLGSPLLMYLAAAGVGRIGIVDFDVVEESNLQRQVIHRQGWIGKPKTSSAYESITEINPYCKVDIYEKILNKDNALEIIKPYDLVCDCTDNFPSRYLINDTCLILGKPNVYGSIERFEGQATVFNLDNKSPNLRDLIPEPPPSNLLPSCSEAGVLGVLPGLIGLIQATEVIKIITGAGKTLNGRLLIFNALSMKFREINIRKNEDTLIISKLGEYPGLCLQSTDQISSIKKISVEKLKMLIQKESNNILLIDVRESFEYNQKSINGSKLIPLKSLEEISIIKKIKNLSCERKIYVYCQTGKRSLKAIMILKSHGIEATNIHGGIDAWNKKNI